MVYCAEMPRFNKNNEALCDHGELALCFDVSQPLAFVVLPVNTFDAAQ